jgi:hypothetical protein
MTAWWFYVVAIPAAALLVNGVPHFVNGISGREFPSPFSGGPGTLDSALRNVFWGAGNLIVGGLLLCIIRDGLANWLLVAELLVVGVAGAAFVGMAFAHPEKYGRRR